jgi:hypothetical protein
MSSSSRVCFTVSPPREPIHSNSIGHSKSRKGYPENGRIPMMRARTAGATDESRICSCHPCAAAFWAACCFVDRAQYRALVSGAWDSCDSSWRRFQPGAYRRGVAGALSTGSSRLVPEADSENEADVVDCAACRAGEVSRLAKFAVVGDPYIRGELSSDLVTQAQTSIEL